MKQKRLIQKHNRGQRICTENLIITMKLPMDNKNTNVLYFFGRREKSDDKGKKYNCTKRGKESLGEKNISRKYAISNKILRKQAYDTENAYCWNQSNSHLMTIVGNKYSSLRHYRQQGSMQLAVIKLISFILKMGIYGMGTKIGMCDMSISKYRSI